IQQSIREFTVPTANSWPVSITAGSDGNLWFTESLGNNIGQITPLGVITEYPVPTANSSPGFITAGPEGNLWFTEILGNNIRRVTPTGSITEFAIPTPREPTIPDHFWSRWKSLVYRV